MAKESDAGRSHGQFLLLLNVTGADEKLVDSYAQRIHDAYMNEFARFGAFTIFLLEVGHMLPAGTNVSSPAPWTHIVRYFGPEASVAWLQREITSVFREAHIEPTMQTLTVSDITGRY